MEFLAPSVHHLLSEQNLPPILNTQVKLAVLPLTQPTLIDHIDIAVNLL